MIPKEHPEAIWPEEQVSLPVEKPPFEETPSWRAWSRLFQALGVVVPLAASFACSFIDLSLLIMTIPLLLGVVSADLLRSWWSFLIVPVAFSMGLVLSGIFLGYGVFLSSIPSPGLAGGPPAIFFLAVFGVVFLEIGVLMGTLLGKVIEVLLGSLLRKLFNHL